MRIALITPHYWPDIRGNAVTVRRIAHHLRLLGCKPDVFELDSISADDAATRIMAGGYELCHAFHAHEGGAVARMIAHRSSIPYIITLTGSDINMACADSRRDETLAALAESARIVAFHSNIAERLAHAIPNFEDRLAVIPQGVQLPDMNKAEPPHDQFTFLLPAGLRPVKDVLFSLEPLSQLVAEVPGLRLVIAGPVLDEAYAAQVVERLRHYPFANYIGAVEHLEMGKLYQQASVVLNTSISEGGMANSLLEAMAWCRPVLAAAIEGNRSLVTNGVTGLLYRDSDEFQAQARQLASDSTLRARLTNAARQMLVEKHAPECEAARYLKLYREIAVAGRKQVMCRDTADGRQQSVGGHPP